MSESSCVVCGKFVPYSQRQFFEDPNSGKKLHWHCTNLIKKGIYKWDEKTKTYKKQVIENGKI